MGYGYCGWQRTSFRRRDWRGEKWWFKAQREVLHTHFIFFVDITQTSPIPVDRRAIATFLKWEGVLIMFMVLFYISKSGNRIYESKKLYFWCQKSWQIRSLALGQPSADTTWGALVILVDLVVCGEVERFHRFGLQCSQYLASQNLQSLEGSYMFI